MKNCNFNIRVYGLIVNGSRLLITDEFRLGMFMTKFPGGGLNFGEGTIDCLKRECLEELGQKIEIVRHFYTTDYFQPSHFLPETTQIINVYYVARLKGRPAFRISDKPLDIEAIDGAQSFRWVSVAELDPDMFTLPVDKVVAALIQKDPAALSDSE